MMGPLIKSTIKNAVFILFGCRIRRRSTGVLFVILCASTVFAAEVPVGDTLPAKTQIEWIFGAHHAVFARHTVKLTTKTGQWISGGEWGIQFQTSGRQGWEAAHRRPAYGLSVLGFNVGEGAHGYLLGLFPHLSLPIYRFRQGQFYFRVGTGLGWVSRPHDSFTNPGENAIGSHWNNITQFKLAAKTRLSRRWMAETGVALTHFSNGGFELPNFGMNLPGFYAGLQYAPATFNHARPPKPDKRPGKRWGAALQTGLARLEYTVLDGPKYALWSWSAAVTWHLHRYNRWALGMDLERHRGLEAWIQANGNVGDRRAAQRGATRTGIFLADEFLYGPVSIYLQTSFHLGPPDMNLFVISRNYNKLAVRYYWPHRKEGRPQLNAGICLKAYKAVAECISFQMGAQF